MAHSDKQVIHVITRQTDRRTGRQTDRWTDLIQFFDVLEKTLSFFNKASFWRFQVLSLEQRHT